MLFVSYFKNELKKLIHVASYLPEAKHLTKLEAIADKLKRGENVQTVSSKRGLVKMSTHRYKLSGKDSLKN